MKIRIGVLHRLRHHLLLRLSQQRLLDLFQPADDRLVVRSLLRQLLQDRVGSSKITTLEELVDLGLR